MPLNPPPQVVEALRDAELIADRDQVEAAVDQLAVRVQVEFADQYPVVVCIMNGGLVMTAKLLERLRFPLQLDYLQVTRYGDTTEGGELEWRVQPALSVTGRSVLLVDDIFDRGHTLEAAVQRLEALGAQQVRSAVLVNKRVAQPRSRCPDFIALDAPDRYLFGCGMDFQGHWRNLPEVYALSERLRTEGV